MHKSNANNAKFNLVVEETSYGGASEELEAQWSECHPTWRHPETRLVQVMDAMRDLEEGGLASLITNKE